MNIGQILSLKGFQIRDIPHDASLTKAVQLMVEFGIGSLLVKKADVLLSIITERDILGAVNKQFDFNKFRVADVMAKELVTCESRFSVDDAMSLMNKNMTGKRIRHLPVVDDGVLRGVVSIGDMIHALLNETKFENSLLKNYIRNWPEQEEF